MSELRQNPLTKQWVIVSPKRLLRPNQFQKNMECPFCPGNEAMTPPETLRLKYEKIVSQKEDWNVRVFPNKYPALSLEDVFCYDALGSGNLFKRRKGMGYHEVIVDTPLHCQSFKDMDDASIRNLFWAYLHRYREFLKIPQIQSIVIFKNAGKQAGCSLEHPHTQILGLPLTSKNVKNELDSAKRYYNKYGMCLYCRMITSEIKDKSRLIFETDNFVSFHPFAPTFPYETWVLPKRHSPCFGETTEEEVYELGFVVREIVRCLLEEVEILDYNFLFQSAPKGKNALKNKKDSCHWYVRIIPKLTIPAGFEIGTGMYINPFLPEMTAFRLRKKIKF